MAVLYSIFFYVIFLAFTLVYFLLLCVVFVVTLPFDRRRIVMHRMSAVWARVFFALTPGGKVFVEGLENIDRSQSYVVVVNHSSMLDIPLMYVLPLAFKWVSKREVYKWPVFGWVLWMHDDITIERGSAGSVKKMVHDGTKWLKEGMSVIVFPEGTRSKDGGVHRFREGAFMLARTAGAAILPCASSGTDTAFNGWKLNLKSRFRLKVLPPISAEDVQNADIKEIAAGLEKQIAEERKELQNRK